MTHGFGMMIEGLVALLLLLTIGYCIVLNRRLKRLRTDEGALRQMIGELITATDKADRSIGGLKVTAQECDHTLGERLRAAERLIAVLETKIDVGEKLLVAVSDYSSAPAAPVRPEPPPASPHDAKAMVAAAQAFAARTRSRTFGRAA